MCFKWYDWLEMNNNEVYKCIHILYDCFCVSFCYVCSLNILQILIQCLSLWISIFGLKKLSTNKLSIKIFLAKYLYICMNICTYAKYISPRSILELFRWKLQNMIEFSKFIAMLQDLFCLNCAVASRSRYVILSFIFHLIGVVPFCV